MTGMTSLHRRELTVAVLLCLFGAFVVLVAAGRAWTQVDVGATGLAPARTVDVLGTAIVPGVRALGLVGLAGVVALAATRGAGRTVMGVMLVAVGAGVVAAVLGADSGPAAAAAVAEGGGQADDVLRSTAWPVVAITGGLLLAAAGLLVTVRGRRWATLSRRFEAPAARADGTAVARSDGPGAATAGAHRDAPADLDGPAGATAAPMSPEKAQRELWESLDRGEDPTGH